MAIGVTNIIYIFHISAFLNDSLAEVTSDINSDGNVSITVTWVVNDEWLDETLLFNIRVTEVKYAGSDCGGFENPTTFERWHNNFSSQISILFTKS